MEYVGLTQVIAQTGISRSTLLVMIKHGRLPAAQPGGPKGKYYVRPGDVKRLMQLRPRAGQ